MVIFYVLKNDTREQVFSVVFFLQQLLRYEYILFKFRTRYAGLRVYFLIT